MTNVDGPTALMSGDLPHDLKLALRDFAVRCERLLKEFSQGFMSKPNPECIYHYTNDVGLNGILGGKLWLTDAFELNDPTELVHGCQIFVEKLKSRCEGKIERHFLKEIEEFICGGGLKEAARFYVCSFSFDGDDLGQWRAYGDNGRGFALGFDTSALESGFVRYQEAQDSDAATFPVFYSNDKISALQDALAVAALPLMSMPTGRGLREDQLAQYCVQLLSVISFFATRAAMFFKHPAYYPEVEYRFLEVRHRSAAEDDVQRRVRQNSFVPYREFHWSNYASNSLRIINVGPTANFERAKKFIQECLAMHGLPAIRIEQSSIPYRA